LTKKNKIAGDGQMYVNCRQRGVVVNFCGSKPMTAQACTHAFFLATGDAKWGF
jgi:hypothetical protein